MFGRKKANVLIGEISVKKTITTIITTLALFIMLTSCSNSSNNRSISANETIANDKELVETKEDIMSNGVIDETDVRNIISDLKKNYSVEENNSGTKSDITHDIMFNGHNNNYNTYTVQYDITSDEQYEIERASFLSTEGDYDFIAYCASSMGTSMIDAEKVTQWIYDNQKNDAEKEFGDATFTLLYNVENMDGSVELIVEAVDNH